MSYGMNNFTRSVHVSVICYDIVFALVTAILKAILICSYPIIEGALLIMY